jgi:hypothetical protein
VELLVQVERRLLVATTEMRGRWARTGSIQLVVFSSFWLISVHVGLAPLHA